MASSGAALFERVRSALGTSQVGLGKMMGCSRRTAQRWAARGVPAYYLPKLAAIVHPHDPDLAVEIARSTGRTLEQLGIVRPAPPAQPAPPPPPAPPPDRIVDAVVCAAADTMQLIPAAVRPGLYAAFACAVEMGLSADFVAGVLRDSLQPQAPARSPTVGAASEKPRKG